MRILWLKTELLHPVDKGGRIRTYQMLKHLKRDHEISYLTLAGIFDTAEASERASEYCHRLVSVPWREPQKFTAVFYRDLLFNLASPRPYAIEKYRSAEMERAIAREVNEGDYDLVVCDFLAPSVNFRGSNKCATVLFQHNVEAMIWRRHYEAQTNSIRRAFFYTQWRKMYDYERAACRRFDAVIAVSETDRKQMSEEFGLEFVYDVPTGVDTEYFQPRDQSQQDFELVFTGSMDWMPNEDAISYFADKILPVITSKISGVRLTVAGRNPGPALVELARRNPQINLTGSVNDIRPYIDRAAACVVPIRIGGGTRLKIYEAMAMAKPVISTTVGAEGLPVNNGKELLIADDPEEFAQAVVRVLTDRALAEKLGRQARAIVCEQFGWERAAARFADVCQLVAKHKSRGAAREDVGYRAFGKAH